MTICLKTSNNALMTKAATKQSLLKQVASVFDPMGLFSTVLIKGKIFLQSLWSKNLNCDDAINREDLVIWSSISSDLSKLQEHQINRCIALKECDGNVRYFLLCFCNASARAYPAVIYLLQISSKLYESRSELVFSNTRLAPLKEITISRLELMAVLIGVRCLSFVTQQLKIPIEGIHLDRLPMCTEVDKYR